MEANKFKNELLDCLHVNHVYDRQTILNLARSINQSFKKDSLSWILSQYLTEGKLQKSGRNIYLKGSPNLSKQFFDYTLSDNASDLESKIRKQYPKIRFVIYETSILNQSLNHLRSSNYIIISVEKDYETTIFEYIQEVNGFNVFINPSRKIIGLYIKNGSIVIDRLGSEYPINRSNETRCSSEGLIVDLLRNKMIDYMISEVEKAEFIKEVETYYFIDYNRMYRYARRRNCETKIRSITQSNE
jgi:hypothetical protein